MAREPRRTAAALDVPRERTGRVRRPNVDPERFGAVSERIARFLGTWTFIGYMSLFIGVWIGWNVLAPDRLRFDAYPLQFLTLILSLQASYAAPLILLAQNRQADRDRVTYEQDRSRSERGIADTEYLTREVAAIRISLGEVATRDFLRSELRAILEELDDRLPAADGEDPSDDR
ncbi:putative membrane protein [Motilibacter rhizosphaerae]|uniref:Putative membrane protein n=1 Tax=Motilibacter rhizosphaerae TaxID=598652 RepID=A0A4Q7NPJ9_9ACTN|nr:DUF1003 domain-containing protein [Motilibacter rhizosphaerae]RZS87235.1 putative membrane protein [Motilibacter rhizosphaerae]